MKNFSVDLEWGRDRNGYRLLEAVAPPPFPAGGLLSGGEPQRIQRRGGDFLPYRPLVEFDDLSAIFVKWANEPNGLLRFINAFGPLTRNGLDPRLGDNVSYLLDHAQAMRSWRECRTDGAAFPQIVGAEGIRLTKIDAVLTSDPITGGPKIRLVVDSLLSGLWLELGRALQRGAVWQQCEHCGELFEVGVGAARRADARFCSDAHRIAFNSLKRSKGGQNHA